MRRSLLATAAFAASIGAAAAADLGGSRVIPALPEVPAVLAPALSYTGCYAGGGVGYAVSTTGVDLLQQGPKLDDKGKPVLDANGKPVLEDKFVAGLDGLGASGHTFSALGGCDLQMSQVVVGAWGDFTWHQDHDVTLTWASPTLANPAATKSVSSGLNDQWSVGGRAGVLVGPSLVYGLVGYTEASLDIGDHAGLIYGGGIELPLGAGFALQAQYTYSDLDSERYQILDNKGKPTGASFDVDPDVHAVRAALVYRIGFGR
jgi:opacity protein-like surface antigen